FVGARVAHDAIDLKPLVAPKVAKLLIGGGSGLRPELQQSILLSLSVDRFNQSRSKRFRLRTTQIVFRELK
ncbi:hypothetical protein QIG14_27170, partial [Klebsiella pneumoniae]|nr:hypothetical protein [Klebsiella pneumoniae]